MQKVSDMYNEETPYDQFIDKKSGDIKVNQICQQLSVALWGLVMAKAKATFSLADLTDSKKIKSKISKVFYLGIMVAIAQAIKISADRNYVNHFLEDVEIHIDSAMNTKMDVPSHGPVVKSERYDLKEMSEFRSSQVSSLIESGEINDFNIMNRVSSKSIESLQADIKKSKSKTPKVRSDSKQKASYKQVTQILSVLGAGYITIVCLYLSNQFHQQTEELEKLNRIYSNPKAKVVKGEKQGKQIIAKLQAGGDQSDLRNDMDDGRVLQGLSGKTGMVGMDQYQPPSYSENNQNPFNYSLCDIQSTRSDDEPIPSTFAPTFDKQNPLL